MLKGIVHLKMTKPKLQHRLIKKIPITKKQTKKLTYTYNSMQFHSIFTQIMITWADY